MPRILILASNPLKPGETFTSPTWHTFKEWLCAAGFSLSECTWAYATQLVGHPESLTLTKTAAGKTPHHKVGDVYLPAKAKEDFLTPLPEADLILAVGEFALLRTCGQSGITAWRGSQYYFNSTPVVAMIHPATAFKKFEWTFLIRHDLSRAWRWYSEPLPVPTEHYKINPTFPEVVSFLSSLPREATLGVDIETRLGYITFIAVAHESTAICIPFLCTDGVTPYWTPDEEIAIVKLFHILAKTNPWVGHNFTYDLQYLCRFWGVLPLEWHDTMIAWHVYQPSMQKSLAFVASLTLPFYLNWKGEGKDHLPKPEENETYQKYNCKDAIRTLAIHRLLQEQLPKVNLLPQYLEQMQTAYAMLPMMLRGVRQDMEYRRRALADCIKLRFELESRIQFFTPALVGDLPLSKGKTKTPWWQSPSQLTTLLYTHYNLPVQKKRGTWQPTTDDKALKALGEIFPLFRPIFQLILELRSLNVFISTFLLAKLEPDNRMRSSYGVGMASTFRCTSSTDAFGYGGNLQNIPKGNE